MNIENRINTRIVRAGGHQFTQRIFCCPVHGDFDLFVFPDAPAKHAACDPSEEKSTGVGLELPKAMKQAA